MLINIYSVYLRGSLLGILHDCNSKNFLPFPPTPKKGQTILYICFFPVLPFSQVLNCTVTWLLLSVYLLIPRIAGKFVLSSSLVVPILLFHCNIFMPILTYFQTIHLLECMLLHDNGMFSFIFVHRIHKYIFICLIRLEVEHILKIINANLNSK